MDNAPLLNIKAATAVEICTRFDLEKEAQTLLHDGMGPREFCEVLVANKQYIGGIDFIAHALPAREAVWWGCLCLQHACGERLSPLDKAACKAAVQWVLEPTEEKRAAAKATAEAAGHASPGAALARAANETGGNFAPPKVPPMPPSPFAPGKAVAGAVKLASIKADPVKITDTHRLFMELGIAIAEGRFVWPEIGNRGRRPGAENDGGLRNGTASRSRG
jgi:hypothetical protein